MNAYLLVRHLKLFQEISFHVDERLLIFSTNNILTKLISYSYHEWEEDITIRDEIKNRENGFLKFSLKHTFYSHILVDHLGFCGGISQQFQIIYQIFWQLERGEFALSNESH